ncbi:TRAP transporter large permease subunit [Promicromonospora sp. NPDC059942]|uniref:TRAP transporter large permease subunit n=1 Tax=Promicromonospora sp. NPDC059942 TaxID=3347009 RepID=UPI00364EF58F
MSAIWALVVYIAAIIVTNAVLKRNIGESMIAGFVVVSLFAGPDILHVMTGALTEAMQEEVTYAAIAFVVASYLMSRTPILDRLIDIMNSLFGRVRGGPVYTSILGGGAMGAIAHIGAAVTASVGSVTIPWMKRSGVSPAMSATVVAGCAGMGITFPFSGTMFILIGSAGVSQLLEPNEIVLPLLAAGLWCLAYRMVAAWIIVRRHGIQAMDPADVVPARRSLRTGWTSLLLFVAILVPVLVTVGPMGAGLSAWTGVDVSDAISLIVWIPVLLVTLVLFLGRRHLPRTASGWWTTLGDSAPRIGVIGVTIVGAFAASNVLSELGLPAQLTTLLSALDAPLWLLAIAVGVLVVAVAIPLTGSATMAAIGPVAVTALVGAGVPAPVAAAAVLVFASTEGASPPAAAPIYVASAIAGVDPVRTFKPLLAYFCLPILALGVLMVLGVLPI